MEKQLTNSELAILSLVSEAPRHGYEIEKLIKARGMREWTDIAFSSIYYLLKRLEKAELITPIIMDLEAENSKERKSYYITQKGKKALFEAAIDSIKSLSPQVNPLMIGLANWSLFEKGEGIKALKDRKKAIRQEIKRLTNIKNSQPYAPDFVMSMFEHALMQLRAEQKWIIRTIKYLGEKQMKKEDLKKQFKEFYQPSAKQFSIVDVPKMRFLMIDGQGSPDSKAYSEAVAWLYSVIYPMKFIAKKKYDKDFVAPPLEGLWWADDMNDFINGNKENWKWRMMIALPNWSEEELQDLFNEAVEKACKKLGEVPKSLRMEWFDEGKSVQIMHIGPYSEEGSTIVKMHEEFMPANGLKPHGFHHEIYLNDPRRVAPEKLKTVLRQPVKQI